MNIVNLFCQNKSLKCEGQSGLNFFGNSICQYSGCNKQYYTRYIQMVEPAMQEQMMMLQTHYGNTEYILCITLDIFRCNARANDEALCGAKL